MTTVKILLVLLILTASGSYCQNKCAQRRAPQCSTKEIKSYHAYEHESRCFLYYECNYGRRNLLKCPNKHIYDENLGKCIYCEDVRNCCKPKIINDCIERTTERLTTEQVTTERYTTGHFTTERPSGNRTTERTTPTGISTTTERTTTPLGNTTVTEPTTETTQEITTTTTKQTTIIDDTTTNYHYTTVNPTISINTTTTISPTTENKCVQPRCNTDMVGITLPYIPDCRKYIYCDEYGNELISVCPSNKYFCTETSVCMDPENANCPDCSNYFSTTATPENTSPPNTACPKQNHCIGSSMKGVRLPYVSNCSKYIYCNENDGTEILSDCQIGEHFSPDKLLCMDPIEANCPYCPVDPLCNINYYCTPEMIGQQLPYVRDCRKYIYCGENGEEQLSICPHTEYFSPTKFYCTSPEDAQCPYCNV